MCVTTGREDASQNIWLFNPSSDSKVAAHPLEGIHRFPLGHLSIGRTANSGSFPWQKNLLATTGTDGHVVVWEIQLDPTAQIVGAVRPHAIPRHKSRVFRSEFSPDGRYLVTCCRDRAARVWDLGSFRLAHATFQHACSVDFAQFLENGRRLVTSNQTSAQRNLYCWDLDKRECAPMLLGAANKQIDAWSSAKHGQFVAIGGSERSAFANSASQGWVDVLDCSTQQPISPTFRAPRAVKQLVVGPGAKIVCAIDDAGKATVWKLTPKGASPIRSDVDQWSAQSAAFQECDDKVHLLIVRHETPNSPTSSSNVECLEFDRSGEIIAAGFKEKPISMPIVNAQFSPDCKWIVAYSNETPPRIRAWSIFRGGEPIDLGEKGHREAITSVVFNSRSDRFITTSADDSAVLWSLDNSPRRLFVLKEYTADVKCAVFDESTENTMKILTAADDQRAILWEPSPDGKEYSQVRPFDLESTPLQALIDRREGGQLMVTATRDGVVRIWNKVDGRAIGCKQFGGVLTDIKWAEGTKVSVWGKHPLSNQPFVSEWDTSPAKLDAQQSVEDLIAEAELMSARRINQESQEALKPKEITERWKNWRNAKHKNDSSTVSKKDLSAVWHERDPLASME